MVFDAGSFCTCVTYRHGDAAAVCGLKYGGFIGDAGTLWDGESETTIRETGSKDAKNTLDGKAEEGDADPGMG